MDMWIYGCVDIQGNFQIYLTFVEKVLQIICQDFMQMSQILCPGPRTGRQMNTIHINIHIHIPIHTYTYTCTHIPYTLHAWAQARPQARAGPSSSWPRAQDLRNFDGNWTKNHKC